MVTLKPNNGTGMAKEKEVRYETNPFVENMVVPVGTKNVKLSPMGKDENILVNTGSGEVKGTHVTTYKKVDTEKFVKIFSANIALTFDLTAAGIKAFNVLIYAIQNQAINKDMLLLDKFVLEDFLDTHDVKMSFTTFMRGLRELVDAQILAKTLRRAHYFINPNFVFSGDRIAFTTVIERNKPKESDIEDQMDLLES